MEETSKFKRPGKKETMLKKRKKGKKEKRKEKRKKKDPSIPEYPLIDKDQKEDEQITVDFQLVAPNKLYLDSLTNMLKFNSKEIAPTSYPVLAEEIIAQEFLGNIVEIEGEEIEGEGENSSKNCYGVATILKYEEHKDDEFMKDYVRFVKSKANQQSEKRLLNFLEDYEDIGLLIVERYYNLPDYIHDIMLNQLVKDQEWAVDNCLEEEDKDCFRFKNLLYIAKCKKRKAKKKIKFENGTYEEVRYYSEKDEQIFNNFEVGIISEIKAEPHNNTQQYTVSECRMIGVITYEKFKDIAEAKLDLSQFQIMMNN